MRGDSGAPRASAENGRQSRAWGSVSERRAPGRRLPRGFPGGQRCTRTRLTGLRGAGRAGLRLLREARRSHLVTARGRGSRGREKSEEAADGQSAGRGAARGGGAGAPRRRPEGSPAWKSSLGPGGESSAQHQRGDHGFSLRWEAPQPGPAAVAHSLPKPLWRLQFQEREEKVPFTGGECRWRQEAPRGVGRWTASPGPAWPLWGRGWGRGPASSKQDDSLRGTFLASGKQLC